MKLSNTLLTSLLIVSSISKSDAKGLRKLSGKSSKSSKSSSKSSKSSSKSGKGSGDHHHGGYGGGYHDDGYTTHNDEYGYSHHDDGSSKSSKSSSKSSKSGSSKSSKGSSKSSKSGGHHDGYDGYGYDTYQDDYSSNAGPVVKDDDDDTSYYYDDIPVPAGIDLADASSSGASTLECLLTNTDPSTCCTSTTSTSDSLCHLLSCEEHSSHSKIVRDAISGNTLKLRSGVVGCDCSAIINFCSDYEVVLDELFDTPGAVGGLCGASSGCCNVGSTTNEEFNMCMMSEFEAGGELLDWMAAMVGNDQVELI